MQHCSAGPAQSRQKYPKIGQISGFLIFLDKIRVGGPPPPYFGAVETKKIGHFSRKPPFCRLFEFWEKTAAKIIGGVDPERLGSGVLPVRLRPLESSSPCYEYGHGYLDHTHRDHLSGFASVLPPCLWIHPGACLGTRPETCHGNVLKFTPGMGMKTYHGTRPWAYLRNFSRQNHHGRLRKFGGKGKGASCHQTPAPHLHADSTRIHAQQVGLPLCSSDMALQKGTNPGK